MVLHDIVWHFMAFLAFYGIVWHYMAFYGILWHFMAFYGILCHFMVLYILFVVIQRQNIGLESRGQRSKLIWSCSYQ